MPPLQKKVNQSSHLHSVVEQDHSKQAQPVTFDWTSIKYPQQWEIKYNELRNFEATRQSLISRPLKFDRSSNSFRSHEPDLALVNNFSRSSFVSSSRSIPASVHFESSHSRLGINEQRGQHLDCPAYRKNLDRFQHYKNKHGLGMFTINLPRENSAVETTNSHNQKSYFPGRNLPDLPLRQFSTDGSVKKEFLPVKSSGADESVSDEAKLANWGNLQNRLTAKNLDEVTLDLLKLRSPIAEEKD